MVDDGQAQRLLVWMLVFLALSGTVAVLVVHRVLELSLDQRIQAQLQTEATAFRELVTEAGATSAAELGEAVDQFSGRATSVPQTSFVFADGEQVAPVDGGDPFVVPQDTRAAWAGLDMPAQGVSESPAGEISYLALPIRQASDSGPIGVFVVAALSGPQRADIRDAVSLVAVSLLIVFVAAAVVWWWVTHRVLPRRRPAGPGQQISVDARDAAGGPDGATVHDRDATVVPHAPPETPGRTAGPRAATMQETRRTIDVTDGTVAGPAGGGRPPRHPVVVDSVELGRLLVDAYSRAQRLADRDWVMDIPPAAVIRCDYRSLLDVLTAVTADAASRTQAGDTIVIGATDHGEQAEISVIDSGGSRAPFADDAAGLSTVRTIARAHGGDVQVAPAARGGTAVRIVIDVDPD